MRTTNLALKDVINAQEIEQILALRKTYEAQRKRMEMAESALADVEKSIMARLQAGSPVISPHEVYLKQVERRNVAWKSVIAELIGYEAAEAILNNTPPTITYRLLIKTEAA